MAQAVNVILDVGDSRYDLNQMGLVSMKFNRFIGSTQNATSGILSDMTITMFDKTGSQLLAILQKAQNSILISYGFENNLSEVYRLDLLKFNSTYNNLGSMVSINAIGNQINRKYEAETYPAGTNIRNIIEIMARRNNWFIGPPNSEEFVDIDLKLNKTVFKSPDQTDMQFLEKEILPLANQSAIDLTNAFRTSFWDMQLTYINGKLTFFFRPYSYRGSERRIWSYSYGTSANNAIVSLTNFIDFSFLIRGLSIQVPMTAVDALVLNEEDLQEKVESVIKNKIEAVAEYLEENNIATLNPRNFLWNVEVVPSEDIGDLTVEEIVLNEVKRVINAISTIELEVIGNPKIMPTDLIDLLVMNKDGTPNIISSGNSSYWRVIGIEENIGLAGYTTKMKLVREVVNFNTDTSGSQGGGGGFVELAPTE